MPIFDPANLDPALANAFAAPQIDPFANARTALAFTNAGNPPQVKAPKVKGAALLLQLEDHAEKLHVLEGDTKMLRQQFNTREQDVLTQAAHRQETARQQLLLEQLEARITQLEQQLEREHAPRSPASGLSYAGSDDVNDTKLELVQMALKDNSFKELIRRAYQTRLGVPHLTPKLLPPSLAPGEEAPLEPGTGNKLTRFRWEEEWDSEYNWAELLSLINWILLRGANIVPAAADALSILGKSGTEERVVTKFQALQKELRKAGMLGGPGRRSQSVAPDPRAKSTAPATSDGDDVVLVKVEEPKPNNMASRASRAKGKLQVRMRKRAALPVESPYRSAKYDTAFTENLMSDDEEELDELGRRTGRYLSYAPLYRSTEIIALFDAVDAVVDPKPSNRYMPRVRATMPRDEPPRVAKISKNKARRWMVDVEWLKKVENKKYDDETRILESGKAWGDDEDPEVLGAKQKRMRDDKKEIMKKKRARIAALDGAKAAKKSNKVKSKSREHTKRADKHDNIELYDNTRGGSGMQAGVLWGPFPEFVEGSSSGGDFRTAADRMGSSDSDDIE